MDLVILDSFRVTGRLVHQLEEGARSSTVDARGNASPHGRAPLDDVTPDQPDRREPPGRSPPSPSWSTEPRSDRQTTATVIPGPEVRAALELQPSVAGA